MERLCRWFRLLQNSLEPQQMEYCSQLTCFQFYPCPSHASSDLEHKKIVLRKALHKAKKLRAKIEKEEKEKAEYEDLNLKKYLLQRALSAVKRLKEGKQTGELQEGTHLQRARILTAEIEIKEKAVEERKERDFELKKHHLLKALNKARMLKAEIAENENEKSATETVVVESDDLERKKLVLRKALHKARKLKAQIRVDEERKEQEQASIEDLEKKKFLLQRALSSARKLKSDKTRSEAQSEIEAKTQFLDQAKSLKMEIEAKEKTSREKAAQELIEHERQQQADLEVKKHVLQKALAKARKIKAEIAEKERGECKR